MRLIALARLLQLCSQALPIGGYSHSQGLEAAIEHEVVRDEGSLLRWISDVLEFSVKSFEIPCMLSMAAAWAAERPGGRGGIERGVSVEPGVRRACARRLCRWVSRCARCSVSCRISRKTPSIRCARFLSLSLPCAWSAAATAWHIEPVGSPSWVPVDVGGEPGAGGDESGAARSIRGATRLARDRVQDRRGGGRFGLGRDRGGRYRRRIERRLL
jgi:hypothetical protein